MQKFKKYLRRSNIQWSDTILKQGNPTTYCFFSVKYLFGEANTAYEFSFA